MLFKHIETKTAEAVLRGAARGAQALGAESIEEYQQLAESIRDDVTQGNDVFQSNAHGLTNEADKAPAKKTTKKSDK